MDRVHKAGLILGVHRISSPTQRWCKLANVLIPQVALPAYSPEAHARVSAALRIAAPSEAGGYLPFTQLERVKAALSKLPWVDPGDEGEVLFALTAATERFLVPTPLWTIHGQAYDLSGFHDHPGGQEWLQLSAGRDATVLFETHHVRIGRARRRLNEFLVPAGAPLAPPAASWDWRDDGFYATVRRRAEEILTGSCTDQGSSWEVAMGPTRCMKLARDFAVVWYFASFVAVLATRSVWAAAMFGTLTAIMGGFGHNALHGRGARWDASLFSLSGTSYKVYRLDHVFGHHCFCNSEKDPDLTALNPVVVYSKPGRNADSPSPSRAVMFSPHLTTTGESEGFCFVLRLLSPLYWHPIAAVGALFLFFGSTSAVAVDCGAWAMEAVGLRPPSPPKSAATRAYEEFDGWAPLATLALLMVTAPPVASSEGIWSAVSLWVVMWLTGSMYYMLVTTVSHNQMYNHATSPHSGGKVGADWGLHQLHVTTDISLPWRSNPFFGMFVMFLHDQSLHHLFPTVDASRLSILRPMVQDACRDFGVELRPPQPYILLYLGLLRTLSGV